MASLPPYYQVSFKFGSSTSLATTGLPSSDATSSLYTTTSASFNPGPGEFAGRHLNAFGKMALSGLQSIVVRRRLQAISSNVPHKDDAVIPGIKEIYSDLLELSRFGLYSPSVRKRALHMILRQITCGQTAQLTQSLLEWPSDETILFLNELLMCMDPSWTGMQYSRQPMHVELQNAYTSFCSDLPEGQHEATPFIKFVGQIANTGAIGSQMVVDANFLDVILYLYINGFVPHTAPTYKSSTLFLECNSVLSHLDTTVVKALSSHPVHLLWPRQALIPLTETVRRQVEDRCPIWQFLHLSDPSAAMRRVTAIDLILFPSNRHFFRSVRRDLPFSELADVTTDIFDDFVDLVEFIRSDVYGDGVATRARNTLIRSFPSLHNDIPLDPHMSRQEVLDNMLSSILREELKYRGSFEKYLLVLNAFTPELEYPVPLTEHLMEVVGRATDGNALSALDCFAAALAVVLHIVKDVNPHAHFPDKSFGPHIFYRSTAADSPSGASPFCSMPISPPNSSRIQNRPRRIHSRSVPTEPYNPIHLVHIGFDPSTGDFTGIPKEWQYLLDLQESDGRSKQKTGVPDGLFEI